MSQEEAARDRTATPEGSLAEPNSRPEREPESSVEASSHAAPDLKEETKEGLAAVDPAIADALKAPKNRHTVLRFEEDVLTFLRSGEEALLFSLSLSGYQRLLAHRTAQYHGLHTATVDDGGEDHGKIKATKPHPSLPPKPRLADIKVPEPPEDQKEQPRSGKKKGGDKPSRREREAAALEAYRAGLGESRGVHELDYRRARERGLGGSARSYEPRLSGLVPPQFAGNRSPAAPGQPSFNRGSSSSGSLDIEFKRRSNLPNQFQEGLRSQFSGQPRLAPGAMDPAAAAQMLAGFSLQQPSPEAPGLAAQHPGLAMPGYPSMQVPVAYVPGVGAVPQAVPNLQGIGMYGSPPVAFGGYGMPVPYQYFPGRPGQQPLMPQMMGQPVPGGMLPYYPAYLPPGYQMPGYPGMPLPQAPGFLTRQGSVPSASGQQPGGLGHRRVSAPVFSPQARVDSGVSSASTTRQVAHSAQSSESVSGEPPSPNAQH